MENAQKENKNTASLHIQGTCFMVKTLLPLLLIVPSSVLASVDMSHSKKYIERWEEWGYENKHDAQVAFVAAMKSCVVHYVHTGLGDRIALEMNTVEFNDYAKEQCEGYATSAMVAAPREVRRGIYN